MTTTTAAIRSAAATVLVVGTLAAPPSGATAQSAPELPADSTQVVTLRLRGGGTLDGRVLARGDTVVLRLLSGDTLRVAADRIVGSAVKEGVWVDGDFWPADPNRTSLFVGPTARTLPRGQGYMASYELFFPLLGVGVTDHFTLAGGFPLVGEILDEGIFYLAPKARFPGTGPRADVAVGGLVFVAPDDGTAGVAYAVTTLGDRDAALSLGLMGAWVDDDWGEAFLMLGGELRMARHAKMIGESYFSSEAGLIMVGPRFFTDRLSADLGVMVPINDGVRTLLPMVNFMFSW